MLVLGAADTLQGVAGTASAITLTATGVSVNAMTGAETLQKLAQVQLPTAAGVLFTVPANTSYIIKTLSLTNPTGSTVTGVQVFVSGTAGANSLVGPFSLGAGCTATLSDNGWSVVNASGQILTALPFAPNNTPAVTHQWLNSYNSSTGVFGQSQPAYSDLSGSVPAITQLTGDGVAGPGSGPQTFILESVTNAMVKAQMTLNTSGVAIGASGVTLCPLNSVDFDASSICNPTTHAITPHRAGYYQVSFGIGASVALPMFSFIAKNGASVANGTETTGVESCGECLIFFNGSTDVLTLNVLNRGSAASFQPSAGQPTSCFLQVLGPF